MVLGLKPHVEPSFDPVRQVLPTLAPFPHGHPVQHDDGHADGIEDDIARAVDAAFRRPAARNQRSDRSHERSGQCDRENYRREARFPLLQERLRSCSGAHDERQQRLFLSPNRRPAGV